MKKLLMFVVFTCVGLAQVQNDWKYIVRQDSVGVYSNILIQNRVYTATRVDTSIWYSTSDFKNHYITVQSRDSARCYIRYQLSVDKTALDSLYVKDSLSTVKAGGALKSVDVSAQILGSPYVRFVFDWTVSGTAQGTTTNTYDAILTRKQD